MSQSVTGRNADHETVTVKVGQWVEFKQGMERCGKVERIVGTTLHIAEDEDVPATTVDLSRTFSD